MNQCIDAMAVSVVCIWLATERTNIARAFKFLCRLSTTINDFQDHESYYVRPEVDSLMSNLRVIKHSGDQRLFLVSRSAGCKYPLLELVDNSLLSTRITLRRPSIAENESQGWTFIVLV